MTKTKYKARTPFFSVVIPVHNKAPHIERSIRSVLGQSFGDFELLLIDDASTDGSLEKMRKFTDDRIRLLHRDTPGPGGYAARNLGIAEARAEWIAFLDADDEWNQEHLGKMKALSAQFAQAGVMSCGYKIVAPKEERRQRALATYTVESGGQGNHFLSFEQYLEAEVRGSRPVWTSVICIKKNTLLHAGGFPAGKAKRGGDVDTWLRCIEKAGGVAYGDYIGAVYYRDSVNMCTRTEAFLAQVERDSVREMIPRYSGKTVRLLKQFSNRRTISAWRQNSRLPKVKNFHLVGKLYLGVDTPKNLTWTLLALAPRQIFLGLRVARAWLASTFIPTLKKSLLADLARLSRAYLHRVTTKPKPKGAIPKSQIIALSDGDNPTFFGYHDKTPFSADGSKILAMSITVSDTDPRSECAPMKLGYFRKKNDGSFESSFTSFAQTTTWCWQQGCMLQWRPLHADAQVFFNTLVDDGYGSMLFDIEQGQAIRKYAYPIYSLDPKGRYAATLNFSRLGRLRPGYGYALLPDETAGAHAPDNDGLYLLDLQSGDRRLLVSLADLAKSAGGPSAEHYVNHATFSPDGKRIVFFHLWLNERRARRNRLCVYDLDLACLRVLESARSVSHYCWLSPREIMVTTKSTKKRQITLYDVEGGQRRDLYLLRGSDTHPMRSPSNSDLVVMDSYPDRRREQHLYLYSMIRNTRIRLTSFFSPYRFNGQVRCDLHPRWDRSGTSVAVDSAFQGRRKLCVVSLGRSGSQIFEKDKW